MSRNEKAVEVLDTPSTATQENQVCSLSSVAFGGKPQVCDGTLMVRLAAVGAAAQTLQQAHKFAALHAAGKPLFEKSMRRGGQRVLVRIVWPGVLMVCNPETGDVLARSAAGVLDELAEDFRPGSSTMVREGTGR